MSLLADPPTLRGRITRMGIVGLYEYANEVFVFEDGKLVIKGANGAGKSRAMELTFPLLLEGNIAEHRVDTTGKQGRPFAWNLSLGDVYTRRIGYSWLETLMPVGEDGETEHVTVGLGASGGQSGASQKTDDTWFFVLRGTRIHDPARGTGDFELSPGGQPRNRKALGAALGDHGKLYGSAVDYRHAVNDALYGFRSMETYQAMVNLLFLVRRPKLAEVLNPDEFHRQLTASLPELDLTLVKQGAERLDKLERMRAEIATLAADRDAAAEFRGVYDRYARRLAHDRAELVLAAERARQEADLAEQELSGEQDALAARTAQHATDVAAVQGRRQRLTGREHALKLALGSPEARRLAEATTAQGAAADKVVQLGARADSLDGDVARIDATLQRRTGELEQARATLQAAQRRAGETAQTCGVPVGPWAETANEIAAQAAGLGAQATARGQLLGRARGLQADVDAAEHALASTERREHKAKESLEERQRVAAEAQRTLAAAHDELAEKVRWWADDLRHLTLSGDGIAQILAGDPSSGALDRDPIRAAHAAHQHQAANERASVEHERGLAEATLADVDAELISLADGPTGVPARPPWRAEPTATRLWQAVDFAAGLGQEHCDAVEAALEAGGLLDGELASGALRAADGQLLLRAGRPVAGRSLADVLVVDDGCPADDRQATAALLACVALADADADLADDGAVGVGLDGSVRNGPVAARGAVCPASWVGRAARERARLARIAELQAQAERLRGEMAAADELLDALTVAAKAAHTEAHAMDDADGVAVRATRALAQAEDRVETARQAWREAGEETGAARTALTAARDTLRTFVRDHELPADVSGRIDLARSIEALQRTLDGIPAVAGQVGRAVEELGRSQQELADKRHDLEQVQADLVVAEGDHAVKHAELEAVREVEGPKLVAVEDELSAVTAELAGVESEFVELRDEGTAIATEIGRLEGRVDAVADQLNAAGRGQQVAAEAMASLVTHGVVRAIPDSDEGRLVALAARIAAEAPPGEALNRLHALVTNKLVDLREALSASRGYVVSQEYPDEDRSLIVVTVTAGAGPQPVAELAERLAAEHDQLRASISESEQELMAKWIVDGLADALTERLAEVREQVERTNRVLQNCPTHFGIKVGLRWDVDPDASDELRETVKLLQRGPGMLDADAQARLGSNLQALIDAQRDRGDGSTTDQVAAALNYRDWHRFHVMVSQGGETPKRLTSRILVAGSGGERAMMLQLPLLAAVAGFYDGAERPCPRALVLDEAFEGIDDVHARQMLGLLGELDLDFIMASYRLRPFVPMHRFALVNLRRFEQEHIVVGQRSVWTGSELIADEVT